MKKCLVWWCKNYEGQQSQNVHFFNLTKNRYHSWMRAIGRDPFGEKLSHNNVICSEHFQKKDMVMIGNKIHVKDNVVPMLQKLSEGAKKKIIFDIKGFSTAGPSTNRLALESSAIEHTADPGYIITEKEIEISVPMSQKLSEDPKKKVIFYIESFCTDGPSTSQLASESSAIEHTPAHIISEKEIEIVVYQYETSSTTSTTSSTLSQEVHTIEIPIKPPSRKRKLGEISSKTDSVKSSISQQNIFHNSSTVSKFDAVDYKPVGHNEIADNKKLDTLNLETVKFHDRIISLGHTGELLPQFIENDIDIRRYDKGMNTKRILLIGDVMIQCPECKVTFDSDILKRHFVRKHSDIHLSTLNSVYGYTKKFCDFIYLTNGSRPHLCPVCGVHAYTAKLLLKHISKFHKDYKPYKCDKCGKCFRGKRMFNLHFKKFQNLPTCDYRKCDVCSEMISKGNYLNHCKSHKKFVCEECGLSFLKLSHLNMHRVKHRNKKKRSQQLCTVCGILTKNLTTHMKTKHTVRTRKYMCHKCPKLFFSQLLLRKHFENVHLRLKTVKCLDCNKKFTTSGSYHMHYRLKHAKNYKYSCKICEQQFTRSDYFRRHMNNHCGYRENNKDGGGNCSRGGGRKYYPDTQFDILKCKFCPKTFKSVHSLRLHVLIHVKELRYKCNFCDLSFSNGQNRKRHQLKHKDPGFELSCKICYQRSKTKEDLEKHLEKHRNKEKYKCQHCQELFSRKYLLNHHIFEKHTSKENVMEMKQTILDEALEDFKLQNFVE